MTTVRLRNGAEEFEPLVDIAMVALRDLMKEYPIVFYELVQKARNPHHTLWGNTGALLDARMLLERGEMHDSLRNVVLSATEGDGLELRLVSPKERP